MPISQKRKDNAKQSFDRAVANNRLSMKSTESKVFDSLNSAMNLYNHALVELIYGLSEQIDELQEEVKKLKNQPQAPVLARTLR